MSLILEKVIKRASTIKPQSPWFTKPYEGWMDLKYYLAEMAEFMDVPAEEWELTLASHMFSRFSDALHEEYKRLKDAAYEEPYDVEVSLETIYLLFSETLIAEVMPYLRDGADLNDELLHSVNLYKHMILVHLKEMYQYSDKETDQLGHYLWQEFD